MQQLNGLVCHRYVCRRLRSVRGQTDRPLYKQEDVTHVDDDVTAGADAVDVDCNESGSE